MKYLKMIVVNYYMDHIVQYHMKHQPSTPINFNNTHLELCEKFILDGVYGCNMHGLYRFEYKFIENVYKHRYYYQLLFSTPTPTSARARVVIFNRIDNETSGIDISECIFGVSWDGIGYNCNVKGMVIGMCYFSFFFCFFKKFFFMVYDNLYEHDHSFFCFLQLWQVVMERFTCNKNHNQ